MEPLYLRAGGADKLRAVLTDFYQRVFADPMIGFLFRGRDQARLVDKELEFTLQAMGADVPYTGRPMAEVHAPLPILGGQFARRLKLLDETIVAHGLPDDVRAFWIEHTEKLRPLVTRDAGGECDDAGAQGRARR